MFNPTHLPQAGVDGDEADSPAEGLREPGVAAPQFGRLALCVTAAAALTLGVVGTVAYSVWFSHDQQAYADAMANARQSLRMPMAADGLPVDRRMSAQAEPSPVLANLPVRDAASAAPDVSEQSPQGQQGQQSEEGKQQAVWSGLVARAPAAAMPPASVGDPVPATPAASTTSASASSSVHSNRRATGSTDTGAPQPAAGRAVKDPRAGQQDRHTAAADTRQGARQAARQNARHQSTLFARMGLFFRRVSYRQHGNANPQQQDIYSHP